MDRADALRPGPGEDGHRPLARSELPVDTASLARHLIGKVLVRELPEGVASGRIVISADGKSRTLHVIGTDAAGKKVTSSAVYDKQ